MNFTKALDTFTKDSQGNLTEDRFVCMFGYGYEVHIVFHKCGYVNISVSPDRNVTHGEFFPNIYIRENDITPEQAVAELHHQREVTAEKLDEYIAELGRTKEAILAFNELISKLSEI